ncbi:MAG: hypothetical protein QM770_14585 [Tepidisphaeraceae bacterium]
MTPKSNPTHYLNRRLRVAAQRHRRRTDNFTIATWVYLDSNPSWSRIFDFGTGTTSNMFLTANPGGAGTLRFVITTSSAVANSRLMVRPLRPGSGRTWPSLSSATWA